MSASPRPWLPATSETDLKVAVAQAIASWFSDWVVEPVNPSVRLLAPAVGNVTEGGAASLAIDQEAAIAIAHLACAHRADPAQSGDRSVLQSLASAMVDDLVQRFAITDVGDEGARTFVVVSDAGEWSFNLRLTEASLVRLRKLCAGSTRFPVLVPLLEAVAIEQVRLGCHLGEARLSGGDIERLAPGDLIVLDRQIDGMAPLTVEGRISDRGKARIGTAAGRVEVLIEEPVSLARAH